MPGILPLATDWKRRSQLEEAVRGHGGHIAEGFGRFSPPDFARVVANHRRHFAKRAERASDAWRLATNASRTEDQEPMNPEQANPEPTNAEPTNAEQANAEQANAEPNLNTNREARTRKGERRIMFSDA